MTTQPTPLISFPRFARNAWKIHPKLGEPVPFELNPAQRMVEAAVLRRQRAGKPVRLRILKYRQAGMSLYWTHRILWSVIFTEGATAITIAHRQDLPQQWLRKLRSVLGQMPEFAAASVLHRGATTANELYFDKLASRYHIASAEGSMPGMGETIRFLHCSEIASWRNPDALLFDLLPAIPPSPNTLVVQESTGRAVGDWWYKRWWAAKNRDPQDQYDEDYDALFIPWPIQPEYRWDPGEILKLNEEERALQNAYKLDDAQLSWRRRQLRTEFHGDEAAFANQYPSNPTEAFLAGGLNVYNAQQMMKARETVRKPLWRGEIVPDRSNPANFRLVGSDGGSLQIWDHDPRKGELPDPTRHWAIGADCQWGTKSTKIQGQVREPDYDAAYSECVENGKIGMAIHGRWQMGTWARLLASLGHYYSHDREGPARLAPERNTEAAKGVILPLLGMAGNDWRYPNLYVRLKQQKFGGLRAEDYGWLTDLHKPEIVLLSMEWFDSPRGLDCPDEALADELASIIRKENNKIEAPDGQHDDRWMARLITGKVARDYLDEIIANQQFRSEYGKMSDHQRRVLEYVEADEKKDAEWAEAQEHGDEKW